MQRDNLRRMMQNREKKNSVTLSVVIGSWSQIVLVFLFSTALFQKLRDHRAFEQSVAGFAIVPTTWVAPLARLFLGGEGLVVLFLVLGLLGGGWPRVAGLFLAAFLLFLFSGALLSVLARGLAVPCSCFGAQHEHPVSHFDVIRNAGLCVCAVLALVPTFTTTSLISYPASITVLSALSAATFVVLWTHLDVIAMAFSR